MPFEHFRRQIDADQRTVDPAEFGADEPCSAAKIEHVDVQRRRSLRMRWATRRNAVLQRAEQVGVEAIGVIVEDPRVMPGGAVGGVSPRARRVVRRRFIGRQGLYTLRRPPASRRPSSSRQELSHFSAGRSWEIHRARRAGAVGLA